MQLKKCFLKNFRNYTAGVASFDEHINLIVGNNAQGKTNLLEAIYFCALGKSPRTKKEVSLIQADKDNAYISLDFHTMAGDKNIEIVINRIGKKQIKINGVALTKLSSLVGALKVVYFSPDELRLIKDMPEDRRRFLDISISQFDKSYLLALSKYDKVLKQMNAILKKHLSLELTEQQMCAWRPQLISCAEKIINTRIDFVENIRSYARDIHYKLCANEELNIAYGYTLPDNRTLAEHLERELKRTLAHSMELGYILVGPHRDDLTLEINGKSCKLYASQGQQRTVSLSLKLATMEIVKNECGEYPILLLDDVMSELDEDRENALCRLIQNYQTLITATRDTLTAKKKTIHIQNGNVKADK